MTVEYGAHAAPASMPKAKGIFVGGCVARGVGSSFRATAHAHCRLTDAHCGWICIRGSRKVFRDDGMPTRNLMHEYAHILVGYSAGHGPRWRAALRDLGRALKDEQPCVLPTGR